MKKLLFSTIFLSFFSFSQDILGKWYDAEKKENYSTILNVTKDKDEKYSVEIIEVREPIYTEGEHKGLEKMDLNNEDPKLRTRTIKGLKLVEGLYFNKDKNYYEGGMIYNPRDGKKYHVYMWFEKDGTLLVRGYVDPLGWFGKTTKWSRVE